MKYCRNCGTLLEDTQNTCIACGFDTSVDENISLYPLDMEEKIKQENKSQKKRTGLVVTIVGIFVLLVALVCFLIWYVSSKQADSFLSEDFLEDGGIEYADGDSDEDNMIEYEEGDEDMDEYLIDYQEEQEMLNTDFISEETVEAPPVEEAAVEQPTEKVFKDDQGSYYVLASASDSAGNVVFNTVCPEDFVNVNSSIDYGKYSTRFPATLTFSASNENGNVSLTYISPQHFWFRDSSKGKSRSNERDVFKYMTYYTYDGVKPYLEALINTSYRDIKKLEFIEKKTLDEGVDAVLKEASDKHTSVLTGDIGDYASICSDTSYAAMEADHESCIYSYKATSKQNNEIYMDFYIPVLANTLSYASTKENDSGDVVEWVVPCIIAYEAGNLELYNYYKLAYKTFIYNSKLTREFFYDNYKHGEYIKTSIHDGITPAALSTVKLKEYHGSYTDSADIGSYNENLYKFLCSTPATCSKFAKENGSTYVLPGKFKVGYFSDEKTKLFVSPDEAEYPGEGYTELTATVGTPNPDDEIADTATEENQGLM